MAELPGFTKEERIIFGFEIVALEKKYIEKASTKESDSFMKKKEKLKRERIEFLQSLEK